MVSKLRTKCFSKQRGSQEPASDISGYGQEPPARSGLEGAKAYGECSVMGSVALSQGRGGSPSMI